MDSYNCLLTSKRVATASRFTQHANISTYPLTGITWKCGEWGWMASLLWPSVVLQTGSGFVIWRHITVAKVKIDLENSDVTQGISELSGERLRLFTCQRCHQKSPDSVLSPLPPGLIFFHFCSDLLCIHTVYVSFCLDYGEKYIVFFVTVLWCAITHVFLHC